MYFANIIFDEDTLILFNLNFSDVLRFNAFFYGYFYDRKAANFSFWLSFGLKKNAIYYTLFFILIYLILNNLEE